MSVIRAKSIGMATAIALGLIVLGIGLNHLRGERLTYGDTIVRIPSRYLTVNPFPWLWFATGLDDDSRMANFKIPASDLGSILPRVNGAMNGIVSIQSPVEAAAYYRQFVRDASTLTGEYSGGSYVPDGGTHLWRIYRSEEKRAERNWVVVRRPPSELTPDDVAGQCSLNMNACNMTFRSGDICVQYWLPISDLSREMEVQSFLKKLIATWRE